MAADCRETAKLALVPPCGTNTLAGTESAGLLLVSAIGIVAAAFDRLTVHVVPPLRLILVLPQVRETKAGVDQSVKVADCAELPTVAVTEAELSAEMLPTAALKEALELPAGTTTFAGTVTIAEFELRPTVVGVVAVCDRLTEQELLVDDIRPAAEHDTEETVGPVSWMVAVADEPL